MRSINNDKAKNSFLILFKKITLFSLAVIFTTLNVKSAYCEPLKVGLILPLSGPIADFGLAVQNVIELVKTERSNFDQIVFEIEDSRYDPQTSLSAFRKLTLNNHSDLVYVWGTTPSVVLAPIADKSKVPLITMTGEPSVIENHPFVIDFVNRLDDYSKLTLEHLRSNGHKKFAIIKTEIQYIESLVEGMEKNLRSDESLVVLNSFPPESNVDLNSTMIKIKKSFARSEFDALGVFLMTGQLSSFYQKMRQFDIQLQTFGTDFFGQEEEMLKAGERAIGAVFSTQYVSPTFKEKYKNRFNNTVQIAHAAIAYDFFTLLYDQIVDDANELSGIELLKKFENVGTINGAGGSFNFVKDSDENSISKRFVFPLIVKKIIADGKSKEVD